MLRLYALRAANYMWQRGVTKLVDKRKNTDIAEFVEEGEI